MGSPSEDDSDDERWDRFHTWDDFKNMGTDAAPRTVMSIIEEPDVALQGMKAFGLSGKNLAIMAGWNPRIRGVRHEVKCPSGRRIEYQMFGRCAKEDPVVLMFPGMFKVAVDDAVGREVLDGVEQHVGRLARAGLRVVVRRLGERGDRALKRAPAASRVGALGRQLAPVGGHLRHEERHRARVVRRRRAQPRRFVRSQVRWP